MNLDQLQVQLRHIIRRKKFLLVLDDLWNEKESEWYLLLKPLRHGAKGSKILVTTRSVVVSWMVGTTAGTYILKCLSDQDCWSYLRHKTLQNIDLNAVPRLEIIGEEIAMKCKGLPLAAKVVGSLMHSKIDEDEWDSILKSKLWDLPKVKNCIVPALRLSYLHLPSHLRQCFAYCSMFPPSHEFEKDNLVRMWRAEGFIQPEGRRRIEDIGNEYFDQLFWMSFFQMEDEKYKMHDAVQDLARSVSGDKFFTMQETGELHTSCLSSNTRHSSLLSENLETIKFEAFYKCKGLRTLLVSREYGTPIREVPFALFQKLGHLRVLDLSRTQIKELSESISNLKHLCFLDLSNTVLTRLPETTHELYSLQTLRLKNCSNLMCLPKDIKRLTSLQHLELARNSQLTSMPPGIGKLTALQTLSEFTVGLESGQIKELKDMNSLRGSLCIKRLEKVKNPDEATDAELVKKCLEGLEFQWSNTVDARNEDRILNYLKPHEGLKELTFRMYGGDTFPAWVSNPLFSKLTSISLYECGNCVLLPALGKLPKLKSLRVAEMSKLEKVDTIFCGNGVGVGFPSLETLEFRDMPSWKSWEGICENDMACLCKLIIVKCPRLVNLPSLHYLGSLQILELENCPEISSLPSEGLPNAIQSLIITACPMLKEGCRIEGSDDWNKIQHVPYKVIDYETI